MTDVAGIAHLPLLPNLSHDEFDADSESNNSLNLGGAKGTAPISLNHMELSLKQYANRMGQPN